MKTVYSFIASGLMVFSSFSMNASVQVDPSKADFSQKSKPATIKVLLAKHAPRALIEIKGRYYIYAPSTGFRISSGMLSKRDFIFHDDKGLHWGDIFPTIFEMRIVPADSQTTILVNGTQYRGCIELYDIDGTLNIVNEVDIENYLKATLTTQFENEMDEEVVEALAIVARTNAYYFVGRNANSFWHVDAKDVNYQGNSLVLQNLQIDRAIENTRYIILTYNQAPFAATWTKDSAGKTADFATIFRKDSPSPSGIDVPLAAKDREKHRWNFSLNRQELAQLLQLNKVSGIDLYLDKKSNKVYGIKVRDENGSQDISFITLQKKIGPNRLKSNDFTISVKGDNVTFIGYGEGAGVGLCLYSANIMAEHGESAQKILATFFPNTRIENMRSLSSKRNHSVAENKPAEKK
jgi:stage II sporulation protein D